MMLSADDDYATLHHHAAKAVAVADSDNENDADAITQGNNSEVVVAEEGDAPTAGPTTTAMIDGAPATTPEVEVVVVEEDYDAVGRDAMEALEQALLARHLNDDTGAQTPRAAPARAAPPAYAAFFDPNNLGAYGAAFGAYGAAAYYGGAGSSSTAYGGGDAGTGSSGSHERWIDHEIVNPLRQLLHDTRDAQRRTEFLFTENNLLRRRHAERQQLLAEITGQQHAAWSGTLDVIVRQQRQLLEQQHALLRALKAFALSSDAAAPRAAQQPPRPPAPYFFSRAADPFTFHI